MRRINYDKRQLSIFDYNHAVYERAQMTRDLDIKLAIRPANSADKMLADCMAKLDVFTEQQRYFLRQCKLTLDFDNLELTVKQLDYLQSLTYRVCPN
jgi:hypothetical protein